MDKRSLLQLFGMMGLVGALIYSTLQSAKKQNHPGDKGEILEVSEFIGKVLNNKKACDSTLVGLLPGEKVREIRSHDDLSKEPFAKSGEAFKQSNFIIKDMRLLSREEKDTALSEEGVGFAYLEITLEHKKAGRPTKKLFPIRAKFSDYQVIATCNPIKSEAEKKCQMEAQARGTRYFSLESLDQVTTPEIENELYSSSCRPSGKIYYYGCNLYKDTFPIVTCET